MKTIITLSIELDDKATKADVIAAIRDAAARASGQIEYDILPYPLEVDEQIMLGSDVATVEEVTLCRTEQ